MPGTIHVLHKPTSFTPCLLGARWLLSLPLKMKDLWPLEQGSWAMDGWIRTGARRVWGPLAAWGVWCNHCAGGLSHSSMFSNSASTSHSHPKALRIHSQNQVRPLLHQENNHIYPCSAGKQDIGRKRVEMLFPEALQAERARAEIPKAWISRCLLSFFEPCSRSSIAQLKTKHNKEQRCLNRRTQSQLGQKSQLAVAGIFFFPSDGSKAFTNNFKIDSEIRLQ